MCSGSFACLRPRCESGKPICLSVSASVPLLGGFDYQLIDFEVNEDLFIVAPIVTQEVCLAGPLAVTVTAQLQLGLVSGRIHP